jgi:hypothetical protein
MSLLATPIRALVFALSGAVLAWLWYNVNVLIPIAAVVFVWIVGVLMEKYGVSRLPDHPVQALRWLEYRVIAIAALTAAAAAVAIVLGVEVAAPGKAEGDAAEIAAQKEAIKAIVSSVGAALAAFVAALAIKAEDADEDIGSRVQGYFFAAYGEDETSPPRHVFTSRPRRENGRILLPRESPGLLAVYDDHYRNLTDWTRKNRVKRAEIVEKYLKQSPPVGLDA